MMHRHPPDRLLRGGLLADRQHLRMVSQPDLSLWRVELGQLVAEIIGRQARVLADAQDRDRERPLQIPDVLQDAGPVPRPGSLGDRGDLFRHVDRSRPQVDDRREAGHQAALRRVLAEPAVTAVGSAVFGLWHIRPTAEALAVNRLAAGRSARIFAVTAVAAGTAGAGAVLSLLRERPGSLAAPVLLHLAANCAEPLASAPARPTDRRGPGRTRRLSPNGPGTSLP